MCNIEHNQCINLNFEVQMRHTGKAVQSLLCNK